jgi:hypothetical protein
VPNQLALAIVEVEKSTAKPPSTRTQMRVGAARKFNLDRRLDRPYIRNGDGRWKGITPSTWSSLTKDTFLKFRSPLDEFVSRHFIKGTISTLFEVQYKQPTMRLHIDWE